MEQTQTETMEQLQEIKITDGQTDNLPPPPDMEQLEQIAGQTATATQSESGASDKKHEYYTKDEFFEVFKSVFDYAGKITDTKSLPIDETNKIEASGARLTSDRLYESAEKYAFMRPLIRRNTTRIMETLLILQFISGKACAVYKEKTNLNLGGILWKKAKKMIGFKGKTQAESASGFSAQVDAEKQQNPANLSKTPAV